MGVRPRRVLRWVACAVLFLAFCIANGLVWEPTHDEGALFEHSVGPIEIDKNSANPGDVFRFSAHAISLVDGNKYASATPVKVGQCLGVVFKRTLEDFREGRVLAI